MCSHGFPPLHGNLSDTFDTYFHLACVQPNRLVFTVPFKILKTSHTYHSLLQLSKDELLKKYCLHQHENHDSLWLLNTLHDREECQENINIFVILPLTHPNPPTPRDLSLKQLTGQICERY